MIGAGTAITPVHKNGLNYERPQSSLLITQSSVLIYFHDKRATVTPPIARRVPVFDRFLHSR